MTLLALALTLLLLVSAAASLLGWWLAPGDRRLLLSLVVQLGGAAAAWLVLLAGNRWLQDAPPHVLVLLLTGTLAVAGGGPLTAGVLWLVDRHRPTDGHDSLEDAGEVLRGGAWIGALERGAIYVALLAGWPQGLAVVLAVKGLGRYPELRATGTGAAERFIIGTMVSVLWVVVIAGAVHELAVTLPLT